MSDSGNTVTLVLARQTTGRQTNCATRFGIYWRAANM